MAKDAKAIVMLLFGRNGSQRAIRTVVFSILCLLLCAFLWYSANQPEMTIQGHSETVTSLAFSPDNASFASGGGDGMCYLRSHAKNELSWHFGPSDNPVESLAFSPSGNDIAIACETNKQFERSTVTLFDAKSKVHIIDVSTGTIRAKLQDHKLEVRTLAFSPDGSQLATASLEGGFRLWSTDNWKQIMFVDEGGPSVTRIAFSPQGNTLATTTRSKLSLWSTGINALVWDIGNCHSGTITSLSFSPDGKILATGSQDETAKLWDAASGKLLNTFSCGMAVKCLAFSPDGVDLAVGTYANPLSFYPLHSLVNGTASIWHIPTQQVSRVLSGHSEGVFSLAFSPDGMKIITGDAAGVIRLWQRK